MDLTESSEESNFRQEARWLLANVPGDVRPTHGEPIRDFDVAWQRTQFEGGWAGIAWPAEFGGRGLSLIKQMIWTQEYAAAEAPYAGCCNVGLSHGGPTLIAVVPPRNRQNTYPRSLTATVFGVRAFQNRMPDPTSHCCVRVESSTETCWS